METVVRELHGIPEDTLHGYLQRVGGQAQPDGGFAGEGWQARIEPLPDYCLGRLRLCSCRITFSGAAAARVWRQFELYILRPGG